MKKFKRLIAIVTVLLFALTLVAPAFAQDESTTNPVYDDAAKVLKDKGVLQGNENGDLMLDKTLTRAEVVTMILRATGQEDVAEEYADADASFSDTADHWAKKYIEAAKELGIVNGYPDGTFKPEAPIKFEELCKLLVAAANETPAAGKWPLNYVKKALDLGFFDGIEDEVGIGQVVVRGQAAVGFAAAFFPPEKPAPIVKDVQPGDNTSFTVTLEAYAGYTLEDGDISAADFEVKDASDETKTLAVKDAVLDVATGKVTVKTDAQVAGKTYKVFFRGQDTTKTFAGAPVDLTVADVTADNLKTLVVKFNDTVDSNTVTTDNIKIANHDIDSVKLLSDNKTVAVVLKDSSLLGQFEKITVTVNNVKSLNGKIISGFSKELTVQDSKQPVLNSAEALNAKLIKLTFSEPVQLPDNSSYMTLRTYIKIDGIFVPNRIGTNAEDNTATLTLNSALTKGTHTIEISEFKDFANFKISTTTLSFTVNEDLAAPQVVAATLQATNVVRVTFNESLDSIGSFTVNNIGTSNVSEVSGTNKTQFDLTLTNSLAVGTTVLIVKYWDQTDMVGNKVSSAMTFTANIPDDTTVPRVTFKVDSGNVLVFTFDKAMDKTKGTIELYNSSNVKIKTLQPTSYFDSNNKVVTIPARDSGLLNQDAASYTVKLKDFVDSTLRANALGEQTFTFNISDSKAPVAANYYKVTTGTSTDGSDDTITIFFNEAIDTATLTNVANYVYRDTGVSDVSLANSIYYVAGSISAASDAKSVSFKFKNARNITATAQFIVTGVKDLAGNVINPTVINKEGSNTNLQIVWAAVYDQSTIEVAFSNAIKSVEPSVFKLVKGSDEYAFTSVSNGGDILTFTTYTTLSSTYAGDYTLKALDLTKLTDVYGQQFDTNNDGKNDFNTNGYALNDYAKPVITVSAVTYGTLQDNLGAIEITATEPLKETIAGAVYSSVYITRDDGTMITLSPANTTITTDSNGLITKIKISNDANLKVLKDDNVTNYKYTIIIPVGNIKDWTTNNDIVPVNKSDLTLTE